MERYPVAITEILRFILTQDIIKVVIPGVFLTFGLLYDLKKRNYPKIWRYVWQ